MKNRYFAMLLLLSAACAAGCADDKEEGGSDIKLNPDPTQLSNITLMKATFAADEFNMISEPGFELFPDEANYRSLPKQQGWKDIAILMYLPPCRPHKKKASRKISSSWEAAVSLWPTC